jgi:hypothetical protein
MKKGEEEEEVCYSLRWHTVGYLLAGQPVTV